MSLHYGSVTAPAGDAFAITPHDTDVFRATALYVGGSGDLSVVMESGTTVTFVGVSAGILPIRVRSVRATGTTATDIVGLA